MLETACYSLVVGAQPDPERPFEPTWSLYVLRCADGTLYTGITTSVERRLKEHHAGSGARYTRGRGPLELVAAWAFPDESSVRRAEARFKRFRRAKKLRTLAHGAAP
jgi:putative endonuclease